MQDGSVPGRRWGSSRSVLCQDDEGQRVCWESDQLAVSDTLTDTLGTRQASGSALRLPCWASMLVVASVLADFHLLAQEAKKAELSSSPSNGTILLLGLPGVSHSL